MNHDCVVVADGSRARFFTLEHAQFPDNESGPNLIEVNDLIQPEKEIPNGDLWSTKRAGGNRSASGSGTHAYDDHRAQHSEEYDKRFARTVAEQAATLARNRKTRNVILVAQKRMLGLLRTTLDPLTKAGIQVREVAKDLSKLNPLELHEHLARERLLPARRHPEGA